jgi:spore maturation protein CgeB
LFERRLVREFNDLILDTASWFKPDCFLAFKGPFIESKTLKTFRDAGISVYNYYPDPTPFQYDKTTPASIWDYDCVFYTKWQWRNQSFLNNFRGSVFVQHGYDPELHNPWPLNAGETQTYAHDVSVIGSYSSHKERIVDELIALMPSLDLSIWGNGWKERCRSDRLKSYIQGHALTGTLYTKAICSAKINLALTIGIPPGLEDQTTTRTYEIPACGGFMLHERSEELSTLFTENEEVACFESKEELAAKVEYYLAHEHERNEIAWAAYRRCVPAYSYDNRMLEILSWHSQSHPSFALSNSKSIVLEGTSSSAAS